MIITTAAVSDIDIGEIAPVCDNVGGLKKEVIMRHGNWIPTPNRFILGLPQGSPLCPVLHNTFTKRQADPHSGVLTQELTLANGDL